MHAFPSVLFVWPLLLLPALATFDFKEPEQWMLKPVMPRTKQQELDELKRNYTHLHLRWDGPKTPAKIYVAAPCYTGQVYADFALSLLDLMRSTHDMPNVEIVPALLSGVSLVTHARNMLLTEFLDDPSNTHLLFIDADVSFTTNDVLRLLRMSAMKPIVGSAYPKKHYHFGNLRKHITTTLAEDPTHEFTDEELEEVMLDFAYAARSGEGEHRPLDMFDGFVRVDKTATGFLMLRRDVLEHMVQHYSNMHYINYDQVVYGLFETMIDPTSNWLLGEDFAFCKRAAALGYEIWLDLLADLKHTGLRTYNGNFQRDFNLAAPASPS